MRLDEYLDQLVHQQHQKNYDHRISACLLHS
jgi:hypothetical protein